ncbi:MAG TPA: SDR family NAD(P)-dependent oxidoreductase [Umezawaea sp.]|nr:SDR family NAD(P)-dependent oxidoreductase [Umezawaea sp.]
MPPTLLNERSFRRCHGASRQVRPGHRRCERDRPRDRPSTGRREGHTVVLAGRDEANLHRAAEEIRAGTPSAKLETLHLYLADLASVKTAAATLLGQGRPLDLLINNAGVMAVPDRRTTADGFELTFGTNHLGHFALTGRLLPALLAAPASRVVTVSAKVASGRNATLDDPLSERSYRSRAWPPTRSPSSPTSSSRSNWPAGPRARP